MPELIQNVTTDRDRPGSEEIADAIRDLTASGLLQSIDRRDCHAP